ncbi:hypothetical protein VR45_23435, partial [Streptomyces sp. NRRL S-495]
MADPVPSRPDSPTPGRSTSDSPPPGRSTSDSPTPDPSTPDPSTPAAAEAAGVTGVAAVTKTFGTVRALGGVTLDFPRGAVTALMGENGAG